MSKKSRYLLGILLTIIIGTVLYWFFCCQYCTGNIENNQKDVSVAPEVTIKPITLNDPDGDFNLEGWGTSQSNFFSYRQQTEFSYRIK